ncbi:MAG: hypothetical protein AB1696_27935 [Planctomycetota bacterium]
MTWDIRKRCLLVLSLLILFFVLLSSTPMLVEAAQQNNDPLRFVRGERIATIWGQLAIASLIIIFSIGVGGLAIQLWARITFPQRTEAILMALDGKRWKLFLVGLVNLAFLSLFFYGFAQVRWLQWLALLVGMVLLAIVFLGLLAKAERLGARILQQAGRTANPVTSVLVGWPVLYFVVIIPLLGQALLLYLIVSGAGAVVLSLVGATPPAAEKSSEEKT